MAKKPSAADRTVDMFTGSTNVEAAQQSDVQEASKDAEPSIEANMDRYRDQAFYFQELVSKNFGEPQDKETFRLTLKGGHMFLEKKQNGAGEAYHWSGFMFRVSSLEELTTLFVQALRNQRERNK